MSALAAELALELGCPVEVSYVKATREVVAVAQVGPSRTVQVSLPVSPIALGWIDDPFAALKYDLLKQLRLQMSQKPEEF